MAIKTTEVGVAVFSDTLNNKVNKENRQISMPLPARAVKVPPMNPATQIIKVLQLIIRVIF